MTDENHPPNILSFDGVRMHTSKKEPQETRNVSVLPNVEIFKTEKEYRIKVNEYRNQLKHMIVTTRFSTDTLLENETFRQRNPKVGCVYCSPTSITHKIPEDMILFVMEMNNTTNKIVGIGMVKNMAICNKYKVYYNISYNRYVYLGRNRISRENMTEEEEEIMKVFDTICFKGASNMKRGKGITTFPVELLYKVSKIKDLVDFVKYMFKRRNLRG